MRALNIARGIKRITDSSFAKADAFGLAVVIAMVAGLPSVALAEGDVPQAAKDALATFSAEPVWMGPETSPAPAKDKFVVAIPCAQAAIGCSRPSDAFLEAAAKLGWKTQMIDPAGDPNKLQAAVKTAIQSGADGIFFAGGGLSALGDTFKEAKDAGVKMVTMAGEGNPVGPDAWDANIYENTLDYGRAAAAYIATNSPDAHVMIVNDAEFPEIDALSKSATAALKEYCPGCTIVPQIDFSIVNISTTMPAQVKAALQADPAINWIIGPYDFASQYVVQATMEIGRGDQVKLFSWGGHPQNLNFIKDGQVQAATVAVGEEWIGYAAADQMNRLLNGEPIWTDVKHNTGTDYGSENYAEQIVDASNLPADPNALWNSAVDFRAKYSEIWGVK